MALREVPLLDPRHLVCSSVRIALYGPEQVAVRRSVQRAVRVSRVGRESLGHVKHGVVPEPLRNRAFPHLLFAAPR